MPLDEKLLAIGSRLNLKQVEGWQRIANPITYLRGFSPSPVVIVFELTRRCNLNCVMCEQARTREGTSKADYEELTGDTLESVLSDLQRSFRLKPLIHFIGGEPSLHRDLERVLDYAKGLGFRCSLTTNGTFLASQADAFVRLGLDRLHVSIDGPSDIHNAIRRSRNSFERAASGLSLLSSIKAEQRKAAPMVTVNCVVSPSNLNHLATLLETATEVGAQSVTFQHLYFHDSERCYEDSTDVDYLLRQMHSLASSSTEGRPQISFYPKMSDKNVHKYYLDNSDQLSGRCIFPWFAARILPNGDVSPCRGVVVGNVKEQKLGRIWNNRLFVSYRRRLAKERVFDDCGRCCHRQF